jgi:hypothetical protein
MKMKALANSEDEAKKIIIDKILFHKVKIIQETNPDTFDIFDQFNKIFGQAFKDNP